MPQIVGCLSYFCDDTFVVDANYCVSKVAKLLMMMKSCRLIALCVSVCSIMHAEGTNNCGYILPGLHYW